MGITFKGITSDSLDVRVNVLPNIIKPQRRSEIILINGKDGADVVENGFAPYILKCKIMVTDLTKLDTVVAWLDGTGVLITPDDPLKQRYVRVLNQVDYAKLMNWKETEVEFYCYDPFRYLITDANFTLLAGGNVTNAGTYKSEPLIKLTGSGYVTVTINGRDFTYNFDTPYVYIDSKIKEAYHLTDLKNRQLGGDFPILDVGVNAISWVGTVTEMVITKRTRYL